MKTLKHIGLCALLAGLVALIPQSVTANTSTSSANAIKSPLSVTAVTEISSSLHRFDDIRHSASASFWLAPSLRFSEDVKLSFLAIFNKELTGERKNSMRNGSITARFKSVPLGSVVKFSHAVSAIIPLNEDARDRQSLVLGLKAAPRLLFDLEKFGLDPITGHVQSSITKNLHQFKTSTTGSSNREWVWTNWLQLNFAIWRKLTLSTSFVHSNLWTYEANRSQSFEISEEIAWDFSDHISLAVGHSNSGNAVKANGLNSNIDLFDPQGSTMYGSLSFSY